MTSPIINICLESLRETANRAYHNISFTPERRAADTVASYTRELTEDVQKIVAAAPADLPADELQGLQERYIRKYTDLLRTWLHSLSNIASAAVVGPANFPTHTMRKRNNWADAHYSRFRDWRTRAMKAIIKGMQPKIDELEQARQRLAARSRYQRVMVAANKLIRKTPSDLQEQLAAFGLSAREIAKLLAPDFAGRTGFKSWQLSNNNAEIRRLAERVRILEDKRQMAEHVGTDRQLIGGIALIRNYEADRVQIVFPENKRPDKDTCRSLRKAGFVFSPTNKAWQRRLNRVAFDIAKSFIEKLVSTNGGAAGTGA